MSVFKICDNCQVAWQGNGKCPQCGKGEGMSTGDRVRKIHDEIGGVASLFGITSWELEFLSSIENRTILTDKQEKILARIEKKVFEEEW